MTRPPMQTFGLFLAVFIALACGGASPGGRTAGSAAACEGASLATCEDAIARAVRAGDPVGPLVAAYAKARAAEDGDDAVPPLLDALREAGKKHRAVMVAPAGAARPASDALQVEANARFSPAKPEHEHALFVAFAEAAGLDYLALVRDGGEVRRYLALDPIAPLMIGLVPVAVDAPAPKGLAGDAALESALRALTAHARAFRYVEAAKAVDEVDALVAKRPPHDALTLRAKLLSSHLGISKPVPLFGADPPPQPQAPAPAANETPYVDLLRVRTDPTKAKAYEKRRARIHAALPAELRPAVDALFSETPASCEAVVPPKLATVRDLAFARLLPGALKPARARAALGRLEIADWYARYGELVATIERTETGFLFAPVLMLERGGASGVIPAGSETHRRATKIALRHAKALSALAGAEPGRVGFAHTSFLVAPGNYGDAELAAAVIEVGRNAASGVLTTSRDPWEILGATLASAFVSFSMPPELREAHLTALQGAFTARLRGDLAKQPGWGVAAAFAVDALYRVAFDLSPDLSQTAEQISRALEAEGTAEPGLAALVSALSRYAALAQRQGLGTPVLEATSTPLPERAAAKAALGKAIARLGDGTPPSARALEDLTALLDGAAATLAFSVAEGLRSDPSKAAAQDVCEKADAPVDPRVVRALGKLADLRRKALDNKAIAEGNDAWSRRARAVTLLVSDAVDLAQAGARPTEKKPGAKADKSLLPRTTFFVKRAEASTILRGAAGSFGLSGASADAAASGYGLLRAVAEGGSSTLDAAALAEARTFVASMGTLLSESREMAGTGALFSVLARAIGGGESVTPMFVDVARSLYGKNEREQADMVLLLALVVASVGEQAVHPSAVALADEQKSEVAWVLKFLRESRRLEKGERVEATSFVAGLDATLTKECSVASARAISELIDAVDRHRKGDRDGARMALDAWLDRAERDLVVPRVSYAFKQETETRVFHLTLEVGLGAPVLEASNSFTFGAGAKSMGDPVLTLQTTVDAPDSKRSRDESARTYVHAAALAGVMHFLAGDATRGEIAAARAVGALTQRTRLYVPGITDEPIAWATDARGTLAVLGQQAADAGRPFLAGTLFGLVRASMEPSLPEPADFAALVDPAPKLVGGMEGVAPVLARAKKTLEVLAGGLKCGGRRSDKAVYLRATCETYATSLGLRIADATAALPTLEARGKGATCADFAAVDAFLQPASRGTYDPDRLQQAAKKLLETDKAFDAAMLLTRQRQPNHCSPSLMTLLRTAAARLDRASAARADLLSAAVNCEASSLSPALITDLGSLDAEIERLGDSSRQLEIGLFAAKLALTHGSPDPLSALVGKPGFVSRQRETGAGPLGFALLLDHASSALAGQPVRLKETAAEVDLLCGRLPPPDRAEICKLLGPLRAEKASPEDRKKAAEDALRRLLGPE